MRRRLTALLAMVVVAAVGWAAPAFAAKGGLPVEHNCGIGTGAHLAVEDQSGPGANEAALFPPPEAGRTGQGKVARESRESYPRPSLLASIHPSAWKCRSRTFSLRVLRSPDCTKSWMLRGALDTIAAWPQNTRGETKQARERRDKGNPAARRGTQSRRPT